MKWLVDRRMVEGRVFYEFKLPSELVPHAALLSRPGTIIVFDQPASAVEVEKVIAHDVESIVVICQPKSASHLPGESISPLTKLINSILEGMRHY